MMAQWGMPGPGNRIPPMGEGESVCDYNIAALHYLSICLTLLPWKLQEKLGTQQQHKYKQYLTRPISFKSTKVGPML